jgi:magnesium transporter
MKKHRRHKNSRRNKVGLPPGSVVHIGEQHTTSARISLFRFKESSCEEHIFTSLEQAREALQAIRTDPESYFWLNVDGVHDTQLIEGIGKLFELHPLTIEDLTNTTQRPKREDLGHYLFVVLKMLLHDHETHEVVAEQVSIVLGERYLISFQEQARTGDVFDYVRARLRGGKGRMRKSGVDYLAYALIDAIVDYYFVILEEFGERIDTMEEEVINLPNPTTLTTLYQLKSELLYLRRAIWPLREVVSGLEREETPLLSAAVRVYMRDVYDHAIQIIDTVETDRELLASMLDIYLSSVSNKLNAVMKVLTILATIFMPLTFIAGVYGMNFKYMPELEWQYGYPATLAFMALLALAMVIYFRRKNWM